MAIMMTSMTTGTITEEYNRIKELAQSQTVNHTVLLDAIASSGQFQSRNRTRLESILSEASAGGERTLPSTVDQGFLDGTAHPEWGGEEHQCSDIASHVSRLRSLH